MTAATLCHTPAGDFRLQRYPARRDEPLQAWCAADLLLLEEIHNQGIRGDLTLVVNDEQGVLCTALQPLALWTDSALSALALQRNLTDNQMPDVRVLWSTAELEMRPTAVALRIPKHLPYLEYQLGVLAKILAPGAQLLASGMDKHLSPRVADLLEQYIGPTRRHRGQRKARLFEACRDDRLPPPPAAISQYRCDALDCDLQALPNVFSQDRLDGGSRLLLAELLRMEPATGVIDLACGNGVLGLGAVKAGLASHVLMADESAMAIASARLNAQRLFSGNPASVDFHHGDGLADYSGPPVQLILCNPPFHLNHAVDDYAGRRLLQQCAGHLEPGGRLCLVANRHLDYGPTLRRCFQRVQKLAHDRRFTVWQAQRR